MCGAALRRSYASRPWKLSADGQEIHGIYALAGLKAGKGFTTTPHLAYRDTEEPKSAHESLHASPVALSRLAEQRGWLRHLLLWDSKDGPGAAQTLLDIADSP